MALAASFHVGVPLLVLGLVSLVLFIVVIVDMVRRPAWQWQQAGSNKAMWIVLEVVLFLLFGGLSIVSGIIYLAAARPKLLAAERTGEVTGRPLTPWGPGGYDASHGGYGQPWGGSGYDSPGGGYGAVPGQGTYGAGTTGHEIGGAPPAYPGPAAPGAPLAGGLGPPETPGEVPPSWQPDPSHRHEFRYWDGTSWTEHVADAGKQSTDPPVP